MSDDLERLERVYVEGGAEAVEADPELRALLSQRPELQKRLAGWEGLDLELAALPPQAMPVAVEERIAEAVATMERPRTARRERRRAWRWALTTVVATAAAAAVVLVAHPRAQLDPPPALRVAALPTRAAPSFVSTARLPSAGLPLVVGAGSYSRVQEALSQGVLPRPELVRIDELVNAFGYDDAQPQGGEPFAVTIEAAPCPWRAGHALVRVGIRGADGGAEPLAEDASAEVRFDSSRVRAYRLLGRAEGGAPGAGRGVRLGRGHAVTSLWELELAPGESQWLAGSLVEVEVRFVEAGSGERRAVQARLADRAKDLEQASRDLRFSAAVALFGISLGGDPDGGVQPSRDLLSDAVRLARTSLAAEPRPERLEFIRLAEEAWNLWGG